MKAFVLKEPGVVGYEQVPEPVLTPYGAILKPVAVAPCSSDVHTVFGGGSRKAPNLVLGHECVARVLEVGEYVTDFVPGELVAVPAITPDWRQKAFRSTILSMHQHHFQVISLDAHSQVSFQSVFLFQMLIRHWRKFQRVLA